ncbi:MAG: phosphoglycerate kinase [Proteobacteria bacterium]|nr:phosphoglycerate kinase [Pseudomonadota bacterium]
MRTVEELPLDNRRVLLRIDSDVPVAGGKVTDDTLVRQALPTVRFALDRGARLVLAGHTGDCRGRRTKDCSMEPVAVRFAELLSEQEVRLADDCLGDGARKVVSDLRAGQVAILENLEFHPGEAANDEGFARALAMLADVYVNDAPRVTHLRRASVHALPLLLRQRGIGFLLKRESDAYHRIRSGVPRPFVALVGGLRVDEKLALIEGLVEHVDALVLAGAPATTFLAARGVSIGSSTAPTERLPQVRSILHHARERDVQVLTPNDVVVTRDPCAGDTRTVSVGQIESDEVIVDIGQETANRFQRTLLQARSVFWSGAMAMHGRAEWRRSTEHMARMLADSGAFAIASGVTSASIVHAMGLADRFDLVSTGGAASLELLKGGKLPGLEVL